MNMKFKEKDIKKMGIALVVGIVIGLIVQIPAHLTTHSAKN